MLEVSDLDDWKFKVRPGYPPKIKGLDQQEACAIFCLQILDLSIMISNISFGFRTNPRIEKWRNAYFNSCKAGDNLNSLVGC